MCVLRVRVACCACAKMCRTQLVSSAPITAMQGRTTFDIEGATASGSTGNMKICTNESCNGVQLGVGWCKACVAEKQAPMVEGSRRRGAKRGFEDAVRVLQQKSYKEGKWEGAGFALTPIKGLTSPIKSSALITSPATTGKRKVPGPSNSVPPPPTNPRKKLKLCHRQQFCGL